MLKKIIFTSVIVVCLGLIGYYVYYQQQLAPVVEQVVMKSPVPSDAVMVAECFDVKQTWNQLSNGNLFYEELLQLQTMNSFDNTWELLDSNLFSDPDWQGAIAKQPLTYSLHPLGTKYQYMLSIFVDRDIPENYIRKKVDELINSEIEWQSKTYSGVSIQEFTQDSSTYYCAEHKGYFLWSPSTILIEKAIRTIDSEDSILNVREFVKMKSTASKENKTHIYINYEALPNFSTQFLKNNDTRLLGNRLGSWAQFDLSIKPNSVLLNGYVNVNDSLNYFLNCFDDQESDDIDLTAVIPSNIAWYVHASISDPMKYVLSLEKYWQKAGKLTALQNKMAEFTETLNWDPVNFQSLVDEEIALGITEPDSENTAEDYCLFMKVKDEEKAATVLDTLLSSYSKNTNHETVKGSYRGFSYWHLGYSSLIEVSFGPLFSPIDNPFFVLIDDRLVVSNAKGTMKDIVNFYLNDKTLAKDLHYNRFMENVSSAANLSVYTNIARAPFYFKNLLTEDAGADIENQVELFRKFQAINIQYEKDKEDRFYQTIFCKYNPVYKNETNSLWELALDTSFRSAPHKVINHNTSAKELLVQDDRNDLYLISSTGKTLWKKKFDSKIIGDIVQIDKYKNQKLQMLFLSENQIHLLDRNGEKVDGFPIDLPSSATSPLSIFDYENNRKYRLLVGCEDGSIYNYDLNGIAIKGWNYDAKKFEAASRIDYFKVGDKDFLLSNHTNGMVRLLNRKGEDRFTVNDSIKATPSFVIEPANKIANSLIVYVDSIGHCYKSTFDGSISKLVDADFERIFLADGTNQRIVGVDGRHVITYDIKGELLNEFEVEDNLSQLELHKDPGSDDYWLSFISDDQMVYLYDSNGALQDGFPLNGSTSRSIINLNADDFMEMVVGDEDGIIYTYTLGF